MKKLIAAISGMVLVGVVALPAAAQGRNWNYAHQGYSRNYDRDRDGRRDRRDTRNYDRDGDFNRRNIRNFDRDRDGDVDYNRRDTWNSYRYREDNHNRHRSRY